MYSIENYEKLRVTADAVILTTENCEITDRRSVRKKRLQILLVKRTIDPYNNMWSLPGGFVDYDKSIDDCVKNKVLFKAGIDKAYTEQLYTYGNNIHRDPRDRVITIAYLALIKNKSKIIHRNNQGGEWFWVDAARDKEGNYTSIKLTNEISGEIIDNVAFDHKDIIIDALNRVKNKILYTDIGFELMDEMFTIKELQNVFETISGVSIPSFRRIMEHRLEDTGFTTFDIRGVPDGFRPARLFRKKS